MQGPGLDSVVRVVGVGEGRIKAASFLRDKSLRACDFDANPNIDPATVNTFRDLRMGQEGRAALPDLRLRHRQVPPADRPGP